MLKKKIYIYIYIYLPYVSKHKSNHEKQVVLLIILNEKKLHYLAVKKLSELLRGITSKHHGHLPKLPSFFWNKKKLKFHKKVCENKDFCNVIMPSKDTKILEFNLYQKCDKEPFIIFADLNCIIE